METPSKQPEISSVTHEEEEEMQHDISKLQDQVQQISLSQKVTEAKMDGLKKGVEANMDGLNNCMEANMTGVESNMDGMEAKMDGMEVKIDGIEEKLGGNIEYLKIDLIKLL